MISHYLATECSTGRTYEVRHTNGVSVGRPVEGTARGPVRIVRFRLACGSVVQITAEVQDLQENCTHPWKDIETTFGGGIVCMKCNRLI